MKDAERSTGGQACKHAFIKDSFGLTHMHICKPDTFDHSIEGLFSLPGYPAGGLGFGEVSSFDGLDPAGFKSFGGGTCFAGAAVGGGAAPVSLGRTR